MKRYEGKILADKSRFLECINTLNQTEKQELYSLIDRYIKENPEYCDEGNHQHLANIFTSMALYNVLLNKGLSKDAAYEKVAGTMYTYMGRQKRLFENLSKYPIFFTLITKVIPYGFRKQTGYGWKYTWYPDEDKNVFRFDCNACIYQQIFSRYKLPEFGPMFCQNDILVYGNLNNIDFQRSGTLSQGFEKCDFAFVRYPKGQDFERTKSQ